MIGFGRVEDITIIMVTGRSLVPDIIGETDIGTRLVADIGGRKADGRDRKLRVGSGQ